MKPSWEPLPVLLKSHDRQNKYNLSVSKVERRGANAQDILIQHPDEKQSNVSLRSGIC